LIREPKATAKPLWLPDPSHAEAKAGENIGQGKPREDVTEKAKQHRSAETDLGGADQASVSTGLCRAKAVCDYERSHRFCKKARPINQLPAV